MTVRLYRYSLTRLFGLLLAAFWFAVVQAAPRKTAVRKRPDTDYFLRGWGKFPDETVGVIDIERRKEIKTSLGQLADVFGDGVLVKKEGPDANNADFADINVPRLLNACRRFEAEMRRVGQTQNANDLSNNIGKVEDLLSAAPADQREYMSPLLRYEKGLGIHVCPSTLDVQARDDKENIQHKLQDPSGAMGLLWIQRSLSFNYKMYKFILDRPERPTIDAALDAYSSVLEPFHGWALRKLYHFGIKKSTLPRKIFLARIGGFDDKSTAESYIVFTPEQEQATIRDMQRLLETWHPLIDTYRHIFHDLDLEDDRRV